MDRRQDIDTLPTFVALDGYAVLAGLRRGSSVQLDETYFSGQLRAIEAFDGDTHAATSREQRLQELRTSRREYDCIDVDIDALTREALRSASTRFRRRLAAIPEIQRLERRFPGRCFTVPEWLQTGKRLHYGARVYFFRDGDSVTPEDVVQNNIEAILGDSFEPFERYQGRLHGYPDCCIEFYHDRSPHAPSPEWRSVEPFADHIDHDALGTGPSTSIDDVLPRFDDWDGRHAFFARDFFPEPGCETALEKGRAISEHLSSVVPACLAGDYFRLTFASNYLMARAVHSGGSERPTPGDLGREHLLFSLPLHEAAMDPRYAAD